jgi:predicted RNA-binding Zn-ribbon protein involved in translation (DUF1610 family)
MAKETAKKAGKTAEAMRCTSCGRRIEAEKFWVEFDCPKCRKNKIIRCEKCKRLVNNYKCPKCGFTGP